MEKLTLDAFLKLKKEDLIGKVFAFRTDTVFALACLVEDKNAYKKIYLLKHRESKPLAILCSDINQIKDLVKEYPKDVDEIMEKYWPGALTIIFDKSDLFESEIETIAFRMPNSKIALKIIDTFGLVYATSINYSGEKEIKEVSEIEEKFSEIDFIVTDYEKMQNVPSTIIMANSKKVIRDGIIKVKI